MLNIRSITFDCADPVALAEFWAAALNYGLGEGDENEMVADAPAGQGPRLLFIKVPEGKAIKNRLHLDLKPEGSKEAEVARLVGLGGQVVKAYDEPGMTWTVMQDPEGNEFCVERGPS